MDKNINYIVSGLERSGTSLMMQILKAGGLPIAYDDSRKPDNHNPKGYYELESGNIINSLMTKSFNMKRYKGKFIKITSWGLKFLPSGKYDIIYMIRDIDEIVDSTLKMSDKVFDEEELKTCLRRYNNKCVKDLEKMESRNFRFIKIYHSALLDDKFVDEELGLLKVRYPEFNVENAKCVIDKKLYRSKVNG